MSEEKHIAFRKIGILKNTLGKKHDRYLAMKRLNNHDYIRTPSYGKHDVIVKPDYQKFPDFIPRIFGFDFVPRAPGPDLLLHSWDRLNRSRGDINKIIKKSIERNIK